MHACILVFLDSDSAKINSLPKQRCNPQQTEKQNENTILVQSQQAAMDLYSFKPNMQLDVHR